MELKRIVEEIKLYIDTEQVKNKLICDLGLQFKNGKCKCFMHSPSADTVMSYDKEKKRLKCFSCNNTYDIFSHYQQYYNLSFVEAIKSIVSDFGLNIELDIKESDRKPEKTPTIHENYTPKVLSYCEKRNISKNTIDYVGVKEYKGAVCFEYRNELGEHIANKYRYTSKNASPKMRFETGTNINTLFNMDKVDITKPLLITEGEFDTLASIESGFKNSVSIPSGVNSSNKWITTNWTWIEQFDEVIIWFDNDEAGINGARDVFNRLPNKSVKIVYCKEANDINELLHTKGKESVIRQINNAYTPMIEGVKTTKQIGRFNIHQVDKLKTGFYPVDRTIIGVPYGSLIILTGRPGEGKSTVLNQICIGQGLKADNNVFLFSGELMEETTKGWMFHTLANEDCISVGTNEYGDSFSYLSHFQEDRMDDLVGERVSIYTDDDYSINGILNKMEVLAKRYGVRIFGIDNLMVTEDDDADEYRNQTSIVKKLKAFAKKYKAIVYLVAHPRKGNSNEELANEDVSGSGNIINLGDYVMSIRRVKNEDGSDNYTSFKVGKNRYTGKLVSIKLKFDEHRRRFYSSDEKAELGIDFFDSDQQFIKVEGEF